MSYAGPTFLPTREYVDLQKRRFEEIAVALPDPVEPLRIRNETARFYEMAKALPDPVETVRAESESQRFLQMAAKMPGLEMPKPAEVEDPIQKTLAYLKGFGGEPRLGAAAAGGEGSEEPDYLGDLAQTAGDAFKSFAPPGLREAGKRGAADQPTPDVPGLPFAGPGLPYFHPSKPVRDPEIERKVLAGEELTVQDFTNALSRAAGKQYESNPAAMEGLPGVKLGTSDELLGRGFRNALTETSGGAGGSMARPIERVGPPSSYEPDPRDFAAYMESKKGAQKKNIEGAPVPKVRKRQLAAGKRAEAGYYKETGIEPYPPIRFGPGWADPAEKVYQGLVEPGSQSAEDALQWIRTGETGRLAPENVPATDWPYTERPAGLVEQGRTGPPREPPTQVGPGWEDWTPDPRQGQMGGPGMGSPPRHGLSGGPPHKVGWREATHPVETVIRREGEAGAELADLMESARAQAQEMNGWFQAETPTVRGLSDKQYANFVDAAEGKANPVDADVTQALAEWDQTRKNIHALAKSVDLKVPYRMHYFPHTYEKGTFEGDNYVRSLEYLVNSGQAKTMGEARQALDVMRDRLSGRKYGNLEEPRRTDLPDYLKTKEALYGYIDRATKRIAQAEHFGPKDEHAVDLIVKIRDAGGDSKAVRNLFDIGVGAKEHGEKTQAISRALRAAQSFIHGGLFGISNLGQTTNTASVHGFMNTLTGIKKARTPQGWDEALRAGVIADALVRDLREGSGLTDTILKKGTSPGFSEIEKLNRVVNYHAGIADANEQALLAQMGHDRARKTLAKMGLDADDIVEVVETGVLTEAQTVKVGRSAVKRSQFLVDEMDIPGWVSSPGGRLLTQFKTFSYKQTEFLLNEIIKPAIEGDVAPLARFIALGVPVGMLLQTGLDVATGQGVDADLPRLAGRGLLQVGGGGLAATAVRPVWSAIQGGSPATAAIRAATTVGGPTVGTAMDLLTGGAGVVQGAASKKGPEWEDWRGMGRTVARMVPVIGPAIQNYTLPYGKRGGQGRYVLEDRRERR